MMAVKKKLTAITVCKKRLHHLKETLPLLVAQGDIEIIVVDYGCPDGTSDWVRKNYPQVLVVEQNDDPGFSLARAKNAGASRATTPWLLFIDADIKVDGSLIEFTNSFLYPQRFYLSPLRGGELNGTFFCEKQAFELVGGYDICYRGWGGEDEDMYYRLRRAGKIQSTWALDLFSPISHDNVERFHYAAQEGLQTNRSRTEALNALYATVKYDLEAILGRGSSDDERKTVRNLATEAWSLFLKNSEQTELFINLGERLDNCRSDDIHVDRRLVYTISSRTM